MDKIISFGGVQIEDKTQVAELYNIEINTTISLTPEEDLPVVFPNISESVCSCNKATTEFGIDAFQLDKDLDVCAICRNELDNNDAPVVKSLVCEHKYHYPCIAGWLKQSCKCPLCGVVWTFIGDVKHGIHVHLGDHVEEYAFDGTMTYAQLMTVIGKKIDMSKYVLMHNKIEVSGEKVCTAGHYSLCSKDSHATLAICINVNSEKIFMKCTTTIKELRAELSKKFNMFKQEIQLIVNNIEIPACYDNLNLYNVGIQNDSKISIRSHIATKYEMDIVDNFMILYLADEGISITDRSIQHLVSGNIAWLAYPHIKISKQELSMLLSSLYILVKKINMVEDAVTTAVTRFADYMTLYGLPDNQISLAKKSMEALLKMAEFKNKDRVIIACTFYDLLLKMELESNIDIDSPIPMLNSNLLCNLILSVDPVEKINWAYCKKQMIRDKIFNVYSPLILNNGIAPLLTLNEKSNIVVYTGKCKDVSCPLILYDTLFDVEWYVSGAELCEKIGNSGQTFMIDDREYEEGIMICIDTSNSMSSCSDFTEDLLIKKKDMEEADKKFYEILDKPQQVSDIRLLKNTVIWFIMHPNFNEWQSHGWSTSATLSSIICLEQTEELEKATIMAQNKNMFLNLLFGRKVKIGNNKYTHKRKSKDIVGKDAVEVKYGSEPKPEYICPIGQDVMRHPVIALDGYTYERENIMKWFEKKNTSPLSGEKIGVTLIENRTLGVIINEWIELNGVPHVVNKSVMAISVKSGMSSDIINFVYDENTNVWDLLYKVYILKGISYDCCTVTNDWELLVPTSLVHKYSNVKVIIDDVMTCEIKVKRNYEDYIREIKIRDTYTAKNIIYAFNAVPYHTCNVWANMIAAGDNFYTGNLLTRNTVICRQYNPSDLVLSVIGDRKTFSGNNSKKYLSRLDIVKKLFDSFVNRSNAYSFNTAIGLISFSNKSKVECEMTPFYESFRDHVDKLRTDGSTALYEALSDASDNLVKWKMADMNKRSRAKLRVICLSDGSNTENSVSSINIEKKFMEQNITLDCIVIGSDFDDKLSHISRKTGGYIFNPSSISYASDVMELETMIISTNRAPLPRYSNLIIPETNLPAIKKPLSLFRRTSTEISKLQISETPNSIKISAASRRIQKELIAIMKDPHPFINVYVNDDNRYFWKVIFIGPESTPYQNGTWLAYIEFSKEYPFVVPNIRFETPIKHCNINNYGRICHSILDRNYTPAVSMSLILQCIYGLFLNPDVTDPLNTNLAMLFYDANGQYEAEILDYVKIHASKTADKWRYDLTK